MFPLANANDDYYNLGVMAMATGTFMLSTSDVAEILGVSRSTVRQFVFQGKLKPKARLGVNLLFDRRTVETFAKKPRPIGRPKKK